MDFSNMEVTIDHIADAGAKIKAYATVTFDGMFKVQTVKTLDFHSVTVWRCMLFSFVFIASVIPWVGIL